MRTQPLPQLCVGPNWRQASCIKPYPAGLQSRGRMIGGLSTARTGCPTAGRAAGARRNRAAGRPASPAVVRPVSSRKSGVPVALRWKFRGSSRVPQTASYTARSWAMVNSSPQKAAPKGEYSSFDLARSKASARIRS